MSAIETRLDHIVIVTSRLEEGVDFCEKTLGVRLVKGGEHVRVGTHNYLLNVGRGVYLEVIAVNPDSGPLDCPRWFGMDVPVQRQRAAAGPYLATFVARTSDISQVAKAMPELGPVRDMRRGALEWKITIPDDGALIEGGALPTLIEWPQDVHPTQKLPESECRLDRLDVFHPQPERLRSAWSRIGLREDEHLFIQDAGSGTPHLVVRLRTPKGIVELR